MAISLVASIARYSLRSSSLGFLPGGKYVPRTVIPASEYSQIWAKASYSGMKRTFEPHHDKTNKMSMRPAKTQISLASAQFDQSLRCPHEETLGL